MIITVLEAEVADERTGDLERAYRDMTTDIPPAIAETFLARDTSDANVFRIMTVWASRAALDDYRASVAKPGGVVIFEQAGATPALSILDVAVHKGRTP